MLGVRAAVQRVALHHVDDVQLVSHARHRVLYPEEEPLRVSVGVHVRLQHQVVHAQNVTKIQCGKQRNDALVLAHQHRTPQVAALEAALELQQRIVGGVAAACAASRDTNKTVKP